MAVFKYRMQNILDIKQKLEESAKMEFSEANARVAAEEEKLSVILDEIGIDKYSDVLDNENAEINFTDVYMKSIRSPKNIDFNVKTVEEELRSQVNNTIKIAITVFFIILSSLSFEMI